MSFETLERFSKELEERGCRTHEESEFIKSILELARQKGIPAPEIDYSVIEPDLSFKIGAREGLSYRQYQKVGAKLFEKQRGLVLADAVGLGKTIQAIAIMNHLKPEKILIVVPAFLRLNWEREIAKWLTYSPEVKVLSYEKFIKEPDKKYDLAVFDEAHYLKGISKRTAKMLTTRSERFLFMSATPMWAGASDMCFILSKAKEPDFVPKRAYEIDSLYWKFANKYCFVVNTPYGRKAGRVKNPLMLRADFAKVFIRRRVQDVLSELPERVVNPIWLEPEGEIEELLKEELKNFLEGKEGTHLSTLRQKIAISKIPHVVSISEEILQDNDRLIVVCWHKEVAKALAEVFKKRFKTFLITGEVSQKDRDSFVEEFQSEREEPIVMVGTIGSMGAGLTLTRASHMVFAELDYIPANIEQAMGRIHRIGTKKNPIYYMPIFDGSVEERIYEKLTQRDRESTFLISQSAEGLSRGRKRM